MKNNQSMYEVQTETWQERNSTSGTEMSRQGCEKRKQQKSKHEE